MLLFEKVFHSIFFSNKIYGPLKEKKWWYHNTIHKTYMSMVISYFGKFPQIYFRINCMIWFDKNQSKSIAKNHEIDFATFQIQIFYVFCLTIHMYCMTTNLQFAIQTSIVLLHTPWKIVFAFVWWFIQFEIASDAPQ